MSAAGIIGLRFLGFLPTFGLRRVGHHYLLPAHIRQVLMK
jgi:hypothetical protein